MAKARDKAAQLERKQMKNHLRTEITAEYHSKIERRVRRAHDGESQINRKWTHSFPTILVGVGFEIGSFDLLPACLVSQFQAFAPCGLLLLADFCYLRAFSTTGSGAAYDNRRHDRNGGTEVP